MQRRIVTVAVVALLFALFSDARGETSDAGKDAWDQWWGNDDPEPERRRVVQPSAIRHATVATASDEEPGQPSNDGHHLSGLGLDVGTPIPEVLVADFDGQRYPITSLLTPGISVALIFVTPSCPPCQRLMSSLPELATASAPNLQVILVSVGTREQNLEKLNATGPVRLLRQDRTEVSEAFNCTTTPAAVIVSPEGRIDSGLAQGPPAIATLITATAARLQAGRG
jgi:hypothetical protein